jgi:hypothetical protein
MAGSANYAPKQHTAGSGIQPSTPPVQQQKRATLARVRRKLLDVALFMDGLSVLISARVGFKL